MKRNRVKKPRHWSPREYQTRTVLMNSHARRNSKWSRFDRFDNNYNHRARYSGWGAWSHGELTPAHWVGPCRRFLREWKGAEL